MQIPNGDSEGSRISHSAHFSIWKVYVPADRNTLQPRYSLQPLQFTPLTSISHNQKSSS